ncbi:S-adenosyl-L-methionine-dependent methyltransferase [Emericellopsis atlantica]|uniref:S-adenosyl-L-methionine-dependent methyltransferase n=1 Tax=Emericellopsis atlantica TaxID=2614577 RepID=A0A9P8CQH1_9HYPO|nr:S-adenosyl-L-methionine-dependent methyltransferase [Emericellopsis atlantica]KAG9253741.1 S-adenosyl-L-methionine-dependent methyltransferase [Emericellopsis atlantica]
MTTQPAPTRIAMRDELYNQYSFIQNAAMRAGLDLIPDFSHKHELAAIDYGCSQGSNSVEPMQKTISTLPQGASAQLVFQDTPYNDFASLNRTVDEHFSPEKAPKDVLLTPHIVPVSFYRQVMPTGFADIGFSWSSLNYLEFPLNVQLDATMSSQDFATARHNAVAGAGAADLVKLLRLRAREIKAGGYFVAAIGGQKPESGSDTLEPSNPGGQPMQAGLMKMVALGKLTMPELMQNALFPSHERTIEEVKAGLDAVSDLWEVEHVEPKLIVHPAYETYQASDKSPEALRKYASDCMMNMVASSGWFWVDVMKRSRGPEWDGGDAFLEELTNYMIDAFVDKCPDLKFQIWYNYIRLKRTDVAA